MRYLVNKHFFLNASPCLRSLQVKRKQIPDLRVHRCTHKKYAQSSLSGNVFPSNKKRLVSRQYKIVVSPKGHSCTEKDFCRTELTEPTELSLLPRRPLCEYSLRHNLVDTTPGHRRSLLEQLCYFDIHE